MSPEIYRNFTLMSFGELFLSFVLSMLTEKMYFKDKDKQANLCTIGFIALNFATVVLTALITKNQLIIVLVNFVSLFVYVLVWFCLTIKKFKFDFNIIQNFKYESLYTLGNVLMLVTYLFGYSSVFSFGGEYVVALNFVNLITDPQWDALEAMDKIAKIDISNSEYNYKKALKNSAVISSTYCLSSIVLFFFTFQDLQSRAHNRIDLFGNSNRGYATQGFPVKPATFLTNRVFTNKINHCFSRKQSFACPHLNSLGKSIQHKCRANRN